MSLQYIFLWQTGLPQWKKILFLLPWWGGQCNDKSLQQPSDVCEGVFASEEKVEERQQDEAVHKQTRQDRDEVHAQLFSKVGRVVHIQDLPCHQEHNAEGEVPAETREEKREEEAEYLYVHSLI